MQQKQMAEDGSSPHTRGALDQMVVAELEPRIIPAYAGSTPLTDLKSVGGGDHPRIRGEHDGPEIIVVEGLGSSPHTRGAPRHLHLRRQKSGIIPAYAGSTREPGLPGGCQRDHPRIRGEHPHQTGNAGRVCGSSPHTRGAPACATLARKRSRIIPAYAGSTSGGSRQCRGLWDHPRIRGEHRFS